MTTMTLPEIVLDGLGPEDDSDTHYVMAHGHVDREAFRAAASDFLGIGEWDFPTFPAVDKVLHVWAWETPLGEIVWDGITEGTIDAFAATILDVRESAF